MENIKLLFQLYFRPAAAMSEILDKGSWFFAAILVLIISAAFFFTINAKLKAAYHIPSFYEYLDSTDTNYEDSPAAKKAYSNAQAAYQSALRERQQIPLIGNYFFKFFSFEASRFFYPLLSISIFYVPVVILLICLFGNAGNFGVVIQRSYGELAISTLMAWSAAHLPFAIAGILLYSTAIPPQIFLAMWFASGLIFGILMIFALRTVFGANYATAIIIIGVAWLSMSAAMYIFHYISPWLFSPFLLFTAICILAALYQEKFAAQAAFSDKSKISNGFCIMPPLTRETLMPTSNLD